MAYKDKDKQREANRKASKRYRRIQGMTVAIEDVIPKTDIRVIPCESHVDASDIGAVKTLHRLIKALPVKPQCETTDTLRTEAESLQHKSGSDTMSVKSITIDDQAKSVKTMAMMHSDACKRGKDITCFKDLPPHVQDTIVRLTTDIHGKMDKIARARRTAIAINYQHLFPDRYHSTGVV